MTFFFIIIFLENLQSVFDNTISKKDDWHKHICNIKTTHKTHDEQNYPAMEPL